MQYRVDGTIRSLLEDAIRQVIADAIADGGIVEAASEARRLAGIYPASGLSLEEIADAIIRAASRAGVASEISRPK